MRTKFYAAIVAVTFILLFAVVGMCVAQDKPAEKMEKAGDKMAMSKTEAKAGPLKSISCDETCGFMIRSHDEKEIMAVASAHIKKNHPEMKMSKKEMMGMIKTEAAEMKK